MKQKNLIIVADDFGLHPAVDRGIIEAFTCGVISTASVLVKGDTIRDVVLWHKQNQRFDLGLHFSLESGTSSSRGGAGAFIAQFITQYELFRTLFDVPPTNLSLHQGYTVRTIQNNLSLRAELLLALRVTEEKIGIPFRSSIAAHIFSLSTHRGSIIPIGHLYRICKKIHTGTNLLISHPAHPSNDPLPLISSYSLQKREKEYAVLTNKLFLSTLDIERIHITSFLPPRR